MPTKATRKNGVPPRIRKLRANQEAVERVRTSTKTRAQKILELRDLGWTLDQIAEEFDLSRQRVHQIVRDQRDAAEEIKLALEDEEEHRHPDADAGNGRVSRSLNELLRGRGAARKVAQFEDPQSMADRIVMRRIKMGMSIRDLSDYTGISYAILSNWENGKAEPSASNLRKLCSPEGLDCSAHWLLFGHNFKRRRKREQSD